MSANAPSANAFAIAFPLPAEKALAVAVALPASAKIPAPPDPVLPPVALADDTASPEMVVDAVLLALASPPGLSGPWPKVEPPDRPSPKP